MNNNINILSLDVGGTFTKWAIINNDYQIIKNGKFPTNAKKNVGSKLIKILSDFVIKINDEIKIDKIGISFPGAIDFKTSVVIGYTPNIPGSHNLNIKNEFKKYLNIPLYIDNDLNVAAMGEIEKGSLKNVENGLIIGIGTGIGSSLIINNKLYRGEFYWAGEVGRQFIKNKKWETIASTSALIKRLGGNITGEEVFENLTNSKIKKVYHEWLDDLSEGFANIITILNPGTIVIGGGISENDKFIVEDLKKGILKYIPKELMENTKLVKAKLGNKASVYGCAYMVLNN